MTQWKAAVERLRHDLRDTAAFAVVRKEFRKARSFTDREFQDIQGVLYNAFLKDPKCYRAYVSVLKAVHGDATTMETILFRMAIVSHHQPIVLAARVPLIYKLLTSTRATAYTAARYIKRFCESRGIKFTAVPSEASLRGLEPFETAIGSNGAAVTIRALEKPTSSIVSDTTTL